MQNAPSMHRLPSLPYPQRNTQNQRYPAFPAYYISPNNNPLIGLAINHPMQMDGPGAKKMYETRAILLLEAWLLGVSSAWLLAMPEAFGRLFVPQLAMDIPTGWVAGLAGCLLAFSLAQGSLLHWERPRLLRRVLTTRLLADVALISLLMVLPTYGTTYMTPGTGAWFSFTLIFSAARWITLVHLTPANPLSEPSLKTGKAV